ncbi:hypothetical protein MTR62_12065 [Novosphingobium sp. 1949]|uniref:Secreted protein n=1 Tax=Novosphingobium organovorum TaxID=2930092 RepID=A0ABT0BEC8_9SPHN|nr:hypothetical protein [Novosphingobium organovorum]MCJ2183418.1 hypothetical protein [Novosphingobium organovorum]
MTFLRSRVCVSLAALAAGALTVSPAMAQGWGGPPPPPHHHHHRYDRGPDGGDLLAGLLIVGGIAAIASAASSASKAKTEESASSSDSWDHDGYADDHAEASVSSGATPAYPGGPVEGEAGYPAPDGAEKASGSGGFGMAVDTCTGEIERSGSNRVDTVDKVNNFNGRIAVEGKLADGRGFACSIDGDGHVRSVAVDGHAMI